MTLIPFLLIFWRGDRCYKDLNSALYCSARAEIVCKTGRSIFPYAVRSGCGAAASADPRISRSALAYIEGSDLKPVSLPFCQYFAL